MNYEPGESQTNLFGYNSNWRGPIWFPTNYLLISLPRIFPRQQRAEPQTGWTGPVAKLIQQQGSRGTIVKRDPFSDL